jgi:signal transduction histidine kinase
METYFAAAERVDQASLTREIQSVGRHPVMAGLLNAIGSSLAVLDDHRQLVAFNDSFLKMIGVDDPSCSLGLRLGEAVRCCHAGDEPAGCGTTRYCSTCGAAVAIAASLEQDLPAERVCALTAQAEQSTVDIALSVRSCPIRIEGGRFLLLFLQDITLQQQRAALERTFFHDINNMMIGISGASEALALAGDGSDLVGIIQASSARLLKEIQIQRCLLQGDAAAGGLVRQQLAPSRVLEEVRALYAHHPAARDKHLELAASGPDLPFATDDSLLLRVVCNMVTNALEATDPSGTVKLWCEREPASVAFRVWNERAIPPQIALRVFQRNFSTKAEAGRGLGTYAMRLFGEQYLGGKVGFASTPAAGTTFTFTLPAAPAPLVPPG